MPTKPAASSSRDVADAESSSSPPPMTAEEKKRHRRMQVRRAQIHHRQRKANHLKQLELDVCQLRDVVALARHDTQALRRSNDEMRTLLRRATSKTGHGSSAHQADDVLPIPPQPSTEMFNDFDVLTVSLSFNDLMGTPTFQISPRSSSSSASPFTSGSSSLPETSLTPEQEQRVINFILALEHICWNHFGPGDFHSHAHQSERPRGHALTASAYLMSSAPESVYKDRHQLTANVRNLWRRPKSSTPMTLQWAAPAITLDSLLCLARSLNPSDQETTPVQAWFELASRYPMDQLLGSGGIDALLSEFKGAVHCIHFGAVIERLTFESVVTRVLGPSNSPANALY